MTSSVESCLKEAEKHTEQLQDHVEDLTLLLLGCGLGAAERLQVYAVLKDIQTDRSAVDHCIGMAKAFLKPEGGTHDETE